MLSHLVYAVKGSDVQDVYIAGQQVVRNGQVLTVDVGSFCLRMKVEFQLGNQLLELKK